jgi:hypothetical protein
VLDTELAKIPMLKKIVLPTIGCLGVLLILLTVQPGQAQQESATYFPETGHYVTEPFLSCFRAQGGVPTCGPPITEAFEQNGRLTQYFERCRLECNVPGNEPCEARVSALGALLGHQTPRVPSVPNSMIRDGSCRHFPETGHNVCFSFLAFYLENGGPETLGPPISELTVEPGIIYQYFRGARIEWDTDAHPGEAMHLGSLGREFFGASGLDQSLLASVDSPGVFPTATDGIVVGAYVRVVNTGATGLRMRSGPGLSHATVESLQDGDILTVIGGPESGDGFTWWQLQRNSTVGWCASDWLEPTQAPVVP